MANQLTFKKTKLNIINIDNQIWLTSAELSKALKYRSTKSVTNIFNNNSDEFTENMSMVIELVTNGINNSLRKKQVRIFSLRGCHLIAMLSRTTVAKEFRRWVLDILDREINRDIMRRKRKDLIEVNQTNLFCLAHHMTWLSNFYYDKKLYDIFNMLGSDFGVKIHDHIADGAFVAGMFKSQIESNRLHS